jgi:RF-1 domain
MSLAPCPWPLVPCHLSLLMIKGRGTRDESMNNRRATWAGLSDSQLLAQCAVDTYRASGPGGQKRNKTSSAVRLRHLPSGLIVIAEESRSQHENRARALRRLRQALFLEIRDELPADRLAPEALAQHEDYRDARSDGRLHLGRKDPRFWPAVGVVLDVLCAVEARVSDAARVLGISTGNLIDFLESDPKVWQQANGLRARFGQKPLR